MGSSIYKYINKTMKDISNKTEKRVSKRLDLALPVTLLDHIGESLDISSTGIYLSLQTSDAERFSLGKEGRVDITTTTNVAGLPERVVRLSSVGVIVRTDKRSTGEDVAKLGIAMKFNEKLKIVPDK